MTRILITDDEAKIREMIRKYAEFEGFEVDEAVDGMEAVSKCLSNQYDLVVMDIMMPNLDGFSASKEIRKTNPSMPIILLSALGEEYDRIHAILKRVHPETTEAQVYRLEGLEIDYSARIVRIDGEKIQLSPKEYDLLVYLVKNAGIALTREQILQTVWGYDFFGDDRTLDTHIKLLRKNLGDYSRYVVTLRGVGYRFEKE